MFESIAERLSVEGYPVVLSTKEYPVGELFPTAVGVGTSGVVVVHTFLSQREDTESRVSCAVAGNSVFIGGKGAFRPSSSNGGVSSTRQVVGTGIERVGQTKISIEVAHEVQKPVTLDEDTVFQVVSGVFKELQTQLDGLVEVLS